MKRKIKVKRIILSLLSIFLILSILVSCGAGNTNSTNGDSNNTQTITIKNYDRIEMVVGDMLQLEIVEDGASVSWSSSSSAVTVNENGLIKAVREGKAAITAEANGISDVVMVTVVLNPTNNSTDIDDGDHKPASSYAEAIERSKKGIISGYLTVPDQAPTISKYRPMKNGQYILNDEDNFIDENTYVVVDAYGNEVLRIYRGGGYITLEEVAAYVYAFGDVPANYVSGKTLKPQNSIWGEYLRLNHTRFSGNTEKYPYEPKLPNISGCGGDLYYYEIDIGTTGTDCDPGYQVKTYNDGKTITRGAARIVYGKYDLDHDGVYEFGEHHVFYTYNHYNDFQEYLNYYGGWGEMFGNITGGGKLSSKTNYNPSPYVAVVWEELPKQTQVAKLYFYEPKRYMAVAA